MAGRRAGGRGQSTVCKKKPASGGRSGSGPPRKRSASASSTKTMSERVKVRCCVHGKRVWIHAVDLECFRFSMDEIRASKRKWTDQSWSKRVSAELVQKWKGCCHGGLRQHTHKVVAPSAATDAVLCRASDVHDSVDAQTVTRSQPAACQAEALRGANMCESNNPPAVMSACTERISQPVAEITESLSDDGHDKSDMREPVMQEPAGDGTSAVEKGLAAGTARSPRHTGRQPVALSTTRACSLQIANGRQTRERPRRLLPMKDLVKQERLGQGSFGSVYKCKWRGMTLACKVKWMQTDTATTTDREVRILRHLSKKVGHANVMTLLAWRRRPGIVQDSMYLFFPLYEEDLHSKVKRSSEQNQPLGLGELVDITAGCCSGLLYMHGLSVIHRDLKPKNIVIRKARQGRGHSLRKCSLDCAICDFGNSEIASFALCRASPWRPRMAGVPQKVNRPKVIADTRRVTTLWYAAPEMLLRSGSYSFPIDIWALGLILLEIENKNHVCPAASEWEQLREFLILARWTDPRPDATLYGQAMSLIQRHSSADFFVNREMPSFLATSTYGPAFRGLTFRCLALGAGARATAYDLDSRCRTCLMAYVDVDRFLNWPIF